MRGGTRRGEPGDSAESLPLTVVHGDDVEAVEELAFVFMDPLHLDVEERVGVDMDFVFLLQICRELQFVFLKAGEGGELTNRPQPQEIRYSHFFPRKVEDRGLACHFHPLLHLGRHC